MKRLLWYLIILAPLLISVSGQAQSNLSIGTAAPEISITEWIANPPADTSLNGKYIVLDFWATWCKPCLEAVPHMNELSKEFSAPNVIFLSMTDEEKDVAQTVFDRVDFQTPVVTDEYGQTHINFGDGRKGLAYYPMTVLIDDQNSIRWYGNSANLTREMLRDFLNGKPIKAAQLSADGPYSKRQDKERSMTAGFDLKKWSDMFHDPTVSRVVYIEEVQDNVQPDDRKATTVSMGNGAFYRFTTLKELFRNLFPDKRVVIPDNYANKKYLFAYLDKDLNANSERYLLHGITDQLDLQSVTKKEAGIQFIVKIKDKTLLLESTAAGFDSYRNDDMGNLIFEKLPIADMLEVLSKRTDYYWSYRGKDKGKYAFEIIMASVTTIKESLAFYGLEVIEKPTAVETIYITNGK